MEEWKVGKLEEGEGKREGWKNGRLEDWKIGRVEDRRNVAGESALEAFRRFAQSILPSSLRLLPTFQPSILPVFQSSNLPIFRSSILPLFHSSFFRSSILLLIAVFPAVAQTHSQLALETGVTFGIRNRNDYVLQPIFLTYSLEPFGRRLQLGENWELSHEALLSALHVVIWNGVENRYTGVVFRGRFSLHSTKSPWTISLDGGGGVGVFDSTRADAAQGQDFAFNITTSLKVRYRLRDHLELYAGVLYQHYSNLDLSEPEVPNVGLDSAGPIVGMGWEF
jgi:hypothetical protein